MKQRILDTKERPYTQPSCRIRRIDMEQDLCTSPTPPPGGNEDVGYEEWQL